MIDCTYVAEAARGLRWDDRAFNVVWPEPVTVISERDLTFPAWTGADRSCEFGRAAHRAHRRDRVRRRPRNPGAPGPRLSRSTPSAAGRRPRRSPSTRSTCWTRRLSETSSTPFGRVICCTWPGTPSRAYTGARPSTSSGSRRASPWSAPSGRPAAFVRWQLAPAPSTPGAPTAYARTRRAPPHPVRGRQRRNAAHPRGLCRRDRAVLRLGAAVLPLRTGEKPGRLVGDAIRLLTAGARFRTSPATNVGTSATWQTRPRHSRPGRLAGRRDGQYWLRVCGPNTRDPRTNRPPDWTTGLIDFGARPLSASEPASIVADVERAPPRGGLRPLLRPQLRPRSYTQCDCQTLRREWRDTSKVSRPVPAEISAV